MNFVEEFPWKLDIHAYVKEIIYNACQFFFKTMVLTEVSSARQGCIYVLKYNKNSNIVKYDYNLKKIKINLFEYI